MLFDNLLSYRKDKRIKKAEPNDPASLFDNLLCQGLLIEAPAGIVG
jgi:hypothetical protein